MCLMFLECLDRWGLGFGFCCVVLCFFRGRGEGGGGIVRLRGRWLGRVGR